MTEKINEMFNNQTTIKFKYWGFRNVNVKIFANGQLQMTGLKYENEAKEVGNKIAGSQKAKYDSKMSGGGSTTKRGGAMVLAKQIRKDGESWQSALKRANEQLKK
jgi:hypothetical protein